MTIDQAKETFLFGFIKNEMAISGSLEITRDILNKAYQKTVKFYSDEENINKLRSATKYIIVNKK